MKWNFLDPKGKGKIREVVSFLFLEESKQGLRSGLSTKKGGYWSTTPTGIDCSSYHGD